MKKIGFYSVVCLLLIGCGGGSTTASTSISSPTVDENINTFNGLLAKDLNLTKDISERKLVISNSDPIEDQYLTVINYLRSLKIKCNDSHAEEGPVDSIEWNVLLADASKEHSNDMNTSGIYSHDGSGTASDITGQTLSPARKSKPSERVKSQGYNYKTTGENIAFTAKYPSLLSNEWINIMEAWMKSDEGHCSNIMNPNFREFGMSEIRGRKDFTYEGGITKNSPVAYWTQNFGAR